MITLLSLHGLCSDFKLSNDMEVVATAADGVKAYQKVMEYKPDVLLMDLSMPPGE